MPCSVTALLAAMQTDPGSWLPYQQYYQQLYQRCVNQADTTTAETLYKTAILLSKQRQNLVITTEQSLSEAAQHLPTPLWRIEVLLYLARCYQLHPLNRRLLLIAGCCSALVSGVQTEPMAYPALAAARLLKLYPQATSVVNVLSGCYATERKRPQWQQTLLSLLLTQTEYLSGSSAWQLQLTTRLMLSQSDYELDILQQLLRQPAPEQLQQPDTFADLLQYSRVSELCHKDNKALELYLISNPEYAAPLLTLAGQLNRQQQSVQSARLAIGIIGRDALPAALAQAELYQYLCALNNPWHDVFSQFYNVLTQALQLFMPKVQSADSRILALCCCAPLWLNPLYQRTALICRGPGGYQSPFAPALHCQDKTYLPQLIELLQLYQMDNYTDAVIAWLQPVNCQQLTTEADNLQLAWHASLTLYCGAAEQLFRALLNNNVMHGKTAANVWLQQLAQRSQCYYPLQLKM